MGIYRPTALAEGWVLLAGEGAQPARQDSSGWRAGGHVVLDTQVQEALRWFRKGS
jgi:hypothetical protein